MAKNEGSAGLSDNRGGEVNTQAVKVLGRAHGRRGTRPDFTRMKSKDTSGAGAKWFDAGLVLNRAEMGYGGKLGVWESGKFVLWRQYSGKTFDELEDIVPFRDIVDTDFYAFGSVWWLVMKKMTGKLGTPDKDAWKVEDLGMLMMMKRMQEANGDCLFTRSMLEYYLNPDDGLRPVSHLITLTNGWVKRMRRKGLIEQLPGLKIYRGHKIAMFRVSADGRRVLRAFYDCFREVSRDIKSWVKTREEAHYLRRYVARFTLGMAYRTELADDDETFDSMVELTKRDLKQMGHRGTGSKPNYWPELPD